MGSMMAMGPMMTMGAMMAMGRGPGRSEDDTVIIRWATCRALAVWWTYLVDVMGVRDQDRLMSLECLERSEEARWVEVLRVLADVERGQDGFEV